jgi:hypothetical protein
VATILIVFVWAIGCTTIAGIITEKAGLTIWVGVALGLFLGPIGILVALVLWLIFHDSTTGRLQVTRRTAGPYTGWQPPIPEKPPVGS